MKYPKHADPKLSSWHTSMHYMTMLERKQIKHSKSSKMTHHHPKAIRSLHDTVNQAIRLEKEQKFANLQDAEIMNISPDSSPQNSRSESKGAANKCSISGDRRYKSRKHRNWNRGRCWNFNNKWQNKGCYNSIYSNKDSFQKSKFKNLRKGKYDNKYKNKPNGDRLNKDQVMELIKAMIKHIMQQNLQKDVNEVKTQVKTEATPTTKSDWLATTYNPETYFSDIKSSPTNKFTEIYDVTSGREDGTTFKILREKQKYYTLFDTGAEIRVMNSIAFKKLDLFKKHHDSNILVRKASGKSMDAKGKVTIKFEINGKSYIHTFIVCSSLKSQIIIGHDFLIRNRMSIRWDDNKDGKPIKVLKDQVRTLVKSPE